MGKPEPMLPTPSSPTPVLLPAILSGVLLWVGFFPLSLGFVAWVALVPWLTLVRAETTARRRYLAAWLGGVVFFTLALEWVRVAHPMMYFAWIGLALYCSLYFPLGLYLIRRLDRARLPLWLAVPAVWVGLEYFRAHFPTGFSWLEPSGVQHMIGFGWYFLGYTQHDSLPLIQVADLAGVYGVSFLVAAVNAVGFLWVAHSGALRRLGPGSAGCGCPFAGSAVVGSLVVGALAYGAARLDHPAFTPGPHVALIQGNLSQEVKVTRGQAVLEHFTKLCDQAAWPPPDEPRPDLVVWPETACPDDWYDPVPGVELRQIPARYQAGRQGIAAYVARHWKANTLLGLNTITCDRNEEVAKYNSAVLIGADGVPANRYDKMHLVPFGEYVPLRDIFPWLQAFTPYKGDYSCTPGDRWTRFVLPVHSAPYRFGVLICYEDTDPALARRYALPDDRGDPVDFLVNISNDGWFKGSEEHEQHLAICRFRAVEARRPVLRAVNMGISGILDGDGRVVRLPGESWSASKKVEAVVRGDVPLDTRASVYARLGDWLPLSCWGAILAGLFIPLLACRRAR